MEKAVQAKRGETSSPAFEDILSRLGTVVERLESGEMPLEESLALFEEGVQLSRIGAARLDEAERRVERLLREDGATEPMVEARVDTRAGVGERSDGLEARGSAREPKKEHEVP